MSIFVLLVTPEESTKQRVLDAGVSVTTATPAVALRIWHLDRPILVIYAQASICTCRLHLGPAIH
eukprot:6214015-Pleurochrysis_carterae.AAC.4